MQAKLRIRRWDPTSLAPTSTVVILGKRNTGKSVLIRDLLFHLRDKIQAAVVFSPTDASQDSFGQYIPPSLIHDDYNPHVLSKLLQTQREQWKRGHGSHVMCVLDDCAYNKTIFNGKPLRDLAMNGRHQKCGLMMSLQYCMDLPVALRSQIDVVIACREQILANKARLHQQFFGQFSSLQEFSRVMDRCTANYEVLVLQNNVSSNDIHDCVFWYKARHLDLPSFRIGEQAMWPLHETFKNDGVDPEDDPDLKLFT